MPAEGGFAADGSGPVIFTLDLMHIESSKPVDSSRPPLLKLYHTLVLSSVVLALLLWIGPRYLSPSAPELLQLLEANGAGAISYEAAFAIRKYLPVAYFLAAMGLFFFTWWSRPLFVAAYVVGFVSTGIGGFSVWPAWEATVIYLATLIDGAILAFAFTPPLSSQFSKGPV